MLQRNLHGEKKIIHGGENFGGTLGVKKKPKIYLLYSRPSLTLKKTQKRRSSPFALKKTHQRPSPQKQNQRTKAFPSSGFLPSAPTAAPLLFRAKNQRAQTSLTISLAAVPLVSWFSPKPKGAFLFFALLEPPQTLPFGLRFLLLKQPHLPLLGPTTRQARTPSSSSLRHRATADPSASLSRPLAPAW